MARPDPRKLRAEAHDHVARGKPKKAIEAYLALEAAEPREGAHPHKAGELMHRQGDSLLAIAALVRASEKYARAGFLVKAIAVCKLILRIDPADRQAQELIARLNEERARSAPVAPRHAGEAARALSAGRSLDHVSLGGLSGAIAIPISPGIEEIEIDDLEIEEEDAGGGLGEEDRQRVRAAVAETPFVAVLGEAALARLIDSATLVELGAGDVLFRQGDPGETLYVVESGEVAATVAREGAPVELARLGDGAIFGEIALLTDQPRSATITALAPTRLVAFDRRSVGETLAAEPRATGVLVSFLRRRLVANLVASSQLFQPFAPADRVELARRFRLAEAAEGAEVVVEGARARGLYVVLAGGVEVVSAAGSAPLARLGPGDVFGEISLLEGAAVASVRSRARSLFLVLPAADFREIIMTHPHVLEYVSGLADARKRALDGGPGAESDDLGVDLHLDFV